MSFPVGSLGAVYFLPHSSGDEVLEGSCREGDSTPPGCSGEITDRLGPKEERIISTAVADYGMMNVSGGEGDEECGVATTILPWIFHGSSKMYRIYRGVKFLKYTDMLVCVIYRGDSCIFTGAVVVYLLPRMVILDSW